MSRLLIGFIPYVAMSLVHVATLAAGAHDAADPTKLMLMPFLALAVVWGADRAWTHAHTLLVIAIALSWLGDGAGPLFDWLPTVPMMLLFFGLAHLCYIWLFWHVLPVRRVPLWTLGYAVWYVALLAVLWPSLGALLGPVAVYGLVLGATAVGAARCHPLIAWGGLFFLASDSVLAFRLFMPEVLPDWSSPLVMATYCLGQGLIAAGVVVSARRLRIPKEGAAPAVVEKEHV
ncbi:lysoplasmalogenase [Microbacterium sp. NPDC056003]|uniref:lysoplasmalogenase n=1 Tax=Microbacterium sp. NPDC056003 TaxID=3345676 RepID=UPI0035D87B26